MPKPKLCPGCDQPMLPKGAKKRPNEYDHAQGCPYAPVRDIEEAVARGFGSQERVGQMPTAKDFDAPTSVQSTDNPQEPSNGAQGGQL